MDQILDTD